MPADLPVPHPQSHCWSNVLHRYCGAKRHERLSRTNSLATVLFAIIPSGRMFGDRVAGTSRKYLASQTFTASYGISSGTLFSIAHSFTLGLSIRTPWKDIYTRLLKRIYDAKLSASPDMEVKYKTRFIYLPRTCREDLFTYFLLGSRLTTLECDHDT